MSENKFPYTIASDMFFVATIGDETIEFHLVELTDTNPDNSEPIGYGIWTQQNDHGALVARFATMDHELAVAFMVLFNSAVLGGVSEYAELVLNEMFGQPEQPNNQLVIPDTATVEAISK